MSQTVDDPFLRARVIVFAWRVALLNRMRPADLGVLAPERFGLPAHPETYGDHVGWRTYEAAVLPYLVRFLELAEDDREPPDQLA